MKEFAGFFNPCTPPHFSRGPAESFKTVPSTNTVQSLLNMLICSWLLFATVKQSNSSSEWSL